MGHSTLQFVSGGQEPSEHKRVRKEKKNSEDVDHDDCLLRLPHPMRDFVAVKSTYIPIPAVVLVMRSTLQLRRLGSYDETVRPK